MSVKAIREDGGRVVLYGGRDVREKEKREGRSGSGGGGKEEAKGKRRGKGVCKVCMGTCCGMARELEENLASMWEMGGKYKGEV